MNKVNEINEKLIKVLEEKIQLLEEQKAINEKIIGIQKDQLNLCGVSQQRELLIAYDKWHFLNEKYHSLTSEEIVDKYLKAINCG